MNVKPKRLLVGGAVTLALVFTPLAASQAWVNVGMSTQYPSTGGTWQYGFSNAKLRSHYTVNRCHGSTVQKVIDGGIAATSRSANTASGRTSVAEITTVNSPGLKANYFYRVC